MNTRSSRPTSPPTPANRARNRSRPAASANGALFNTSRARGTAANIRAQHAKTPSFSRIVRPKCPNVTNPLRNAGKSPTAGIPSGA